MKSPGIRIAVWLIALYKLTLSPDHGVFRGLFPFGVCRYTPTCSQFCQEALERHGWRGLPIAAQRILRCHPWGGSGHDPVPSQVGHLRLPR